MLTPAWAGTRRRLRGRMISPAAATQEYQPRTDGKCGLSGNLCISARPGPRVCPLAGRPVALGCPVQVRPSNRLVTEPSLKTSWMARPMSGAIDSTVSLSKRFSAGMGSVLVTMTSLIREFLR